MSIPTAPHQGRLMSFLQSPVYHAIFSVITFLYYIALPASIFYIGYGINHH